MYGDWFKLTGEDGEQTTQRPAVLAIGPAGENLSRMACLIHDAGSAAGQGGFGAVWGSKRLKAISVIGTGSIRVNNPKALMQARLWQKQQYAFKLDNLKRQFMSVDFQSPPVPGTLYRSGKVRTGQRPQACVGCHSACRGRYADGIGNEATCNFPIGVCRCTRKRDRNLTGPMAPSWETGTSTSMASIS